MQHDREGGLELIQDIAVLGKDPVGLVAGEMEDDGAAVVGDEGDGGVGDVARGDRFRGAEGKGMEGDPFADADPAVLQFVVPAGPGRRGGVDPAPTLERMKNLAAAPRREAKDGEAIERDEPLEVGLDQAQAFVRAPLPEFQQKEGADHGERLGGVLEGIQEGADEFSRGLGGAPCGLSSSVRQGDSWSS